MLMEAAKTLAMRLHLARIWLGVFDGNTPEQKLYQKAGFEESGSAWMAARGLRRRDLHDPETGLEKAGTGGI